MVEDKPQEAYKIYSSMMEKLRDDGVLVIAAAGNAPFGQPKDIETYRLYPAMFPLDNIIIVAATDQNGALASFSNFGGNTVSIAAPGKNIWSTLPGSKYGADDGTSMATPLVAGVAALLWSQKPSVGYQRVRDAILHGATSSKKLEGKVIGSRFLNASKSIDEIRK